MEKVISFRVHPEKNKRLFYKVFIFPDKKTMYAFCDLQDKLGLLEYQDKRDNHTAHNFVAICASWDQTKVGPRGGKSRGRSIGQVLFAEPYVKNWIVSHEMTHAAIRWAEKKRIPAEGLYAHGRQHEEVCRAQGDMVRQFWSGLYRRLNKKARLAHSEAVLLELEEAMKRTNATPPIGSGCNKHPDYQAKRKPTAKCYPCQEIWKARLTHSLEDVMTNATPPIG